MAEVVFDHVTRIYPGNDKPSVDDLNLDIKDGEFLVLVGPSGCGKSTTLRMLAGLEEVNKGRIFIGGKDVTTMQPKDRDIAMVFQNYALYPHMTVADNMGFALKIAGTPKDEIRKRVEEAAKILDLTEFLDRKPKALSGGQRQRVAMGRAIVRKPKVFLMDEPLSNLDAKLRNQMRAEIIKLREKIDTTFLYVTHDQVEAMTLGDRIVIMRDGFIQQIGTPQEVFDKPANLFVAGFIGTPQMNFFDAELKRDGDKYTVEVCGEQVKLTEDKQAALLRNGVPAGPVTLGIRPEHIVLAKTGGIPARVDVSEMMGSSVHLHLTAAGHDAVVIVPTLELDAIPSYGQQVSLELHEDSIHLFDRESEKSLLL